MIKKEKMLKLTKKNTQIFTFKVAFKGRRRVWRTIEIRGDQTLADLDRAIRIAFDHELLDHLSEFYAGKKWYRSGFGEINPEGKGSGAGILISSLGLPVGYSLGHVYDFGSEIHHIVTLMGISDKYDPEAHYPRIVARNKPRYQYCVDCKSAGKTTIATVICMYCSEEAGKPVYLCEKCSQSDKHSDHFVEDIVY